MSAQRIREVLRLDAGAGRLFWIDTPENHRGKLGAEAGGPVVNGSGKHYWCISVDGKKYKRGRIVFFLVNGYWPAPCVDHINGDSLDDRPQNLRQATVAENAKNHKKSARRIKLPMGVRNMQSGSYQARITCDGIQHHLGTFSTPDEAHSVYLIKRKELFNDFA